MIDGEQKLITKRLRGFRFDPGRTRNDKNVHKFTTTIKDPVLYGTVY